MLTQSLKDDISALYRRLRAQIQGFRPRRPQAEMIGAIARALHADDPVIAVEAPTGTGKSLAYLTAGVQVALANEKKLVIATATVGLQEQLHERDIPQFVKASGLDLKTVIAKGRRRYLCPRNLALLVGTDTAQQGLGFEDEGATASWSRMPRKGEVDTVGRLNDAFARGDWNGDMDAIPESVEDDLRGMMTTSAGGCSRRQCDKFNVCPLFAAREAMKEANVIVTNIDLLLADLTMVNAGEKSGSDEQPAEEGAEEEEHRFGGVLLPSPADCYYVIDEGHHLALKAIEQSGSRLSIHASQRWLKRLPILAKNAYGVTGKDKVLGMTLAQATQWIAELRADIEQWEVRIGGHWTPDIKDPYATWRASGGVLPDTWVEAAKHSGETAKYMHAWARSMRRALSSDGARGDRVRDTLGRELGLAAERLAEHEALWTAWSEDDRERRGPPRARWVELESDNGMALRSSHVDAARTLRQLLWDCAAGCVITSATLTGGGDFRLLRHSLGLPEGAETVRLESPFNLEVQGCVEVPFLYSLPDARDEHTREVALWLEKNLDWDAGNLVLFTSRKKMEAVVSELPSDRLKHILIQGRHNREALLREHRANIEAGRGSTLFGMSAFGEGLDLPGKLCESVIVTALPFAVPTDPVAATYADWLEAQGRNPFAEVAVPDATRVLTQYCGRLIRTEADTGRVVILDRRIVTKAYGSRILKALPNFRRAIAMRAPAAMQAPQVESNQAVARGPF